MRAYERALEQRGLPTYVIGGRGYWLHPQVLDIVAYLRALANPLDEQALYTVLTSPLVGASLDAVVVLADEARERAARSVVVSCGTRAARSTRSRTPIAGRSQRFAAWFADQRDRRRAGEASRS